MKKEFDVYFSGEILEGRDLEQVKEAIGKLFHVSGPKLEALFTGIPVRVKKNLSVEKAGRFRKVFLESGALVQIVPAGQEPPGEPPSPPPGARPAPPASSSPATGGSRLELAPLQPLETAPPPEQPPIDTSSLELGADDGPIQPAPAAEPPPLPDTSNLSMAPLDENTAPDPRPGPHPPVPDTSHLEMAPANSGSLEDCAEEKPAKPLPDISGLSLKE